MKTFVILFLCVQFFYLLNNRQIYYLLQSFEKIIKDSKTPGQQPKIVFVHTDAFPFLLYLVADLMYLIFCIWLLFSDAYWQQGAMLFLISSLETYAFHMRVDYTYDTDQHGFIYPKAWNRCLFSGLTIYILTKLYTSLL